MKIDVLNIKNEVVENIELNDSVFNIEPNNNILAQYVRVYTHNQRQGTSSTKDRSEVSGGGKKPFKQKGTGRARAGSTRGPLWVGGGVSHGPKPKSWNLNLSKKLRRNAILSALSQKFNSNKAFVINNFEIESPSTKQMANILNTLNLNKTLVVTLNTNINVVKSSSNLKKVKVTRHDLLNTYDLLNYDSVLFTKESVLEIEKKYTNNKELNNEN